METTKTVFEILNLKGSFSNPMIETKIKEWVNKINPDFNNVFLVDTDWNQLVFKEGKLIEVDVDANTRVVLTSKNELERIYKRFFPSKKLENLSPREIYALTKEQKEARNKLAAERYAAMEKFWCKGCETCFQMGNHGRDIAHCPFNKPEWVKEEFSDLL